MRTFNVFDTKARVVIALDPDHFAASKVDKDRVMKIIDVALDLAKIPGFRGCLPCAASGLDEFAHGSRVLPILTQQQG
ncbi:MAG: hypothetical protein JNL66_18405 [Alphaproteobacteria bacterium]|nr:hypothetical protein [Alphaproteobacteria bacterium]